MPPTAPRIQSNGLPVAARGDERAFPGAELRAAYRAAVTVLASFLAALLLGRGYGIETTTATGLERRTSGEWVAVPWKLAGVRSPTQLHVIVEPAACARVVRFDVVESPAAVHLTVWRKQAHRICQPLSIAVDLRRPLGDRQVIDGGDLTPGG